MKNRKLKIKKYMQTFENSHKDEKKNDKIW